MMMKLDQLRQLHTRMAQLSVLSSLVFLMQPGLSHGMLLKVNLQLKFILFLIQSVYVALLRAIKRLQHGQLILVMMQLQLLQRIKDTNSAKTSHLYKKQSLV